MTTDGEGGAYLSPEDAFGILGNETRLDILQVLWEAYEPYADDTTLTFSELYDRVGYDDTGNFNYHLEKLTDHYVRQTNIGYELTNSGLEVVRAIIAGTVNERPHLDPVEIDEACPICGAPIEVDYDRQRTIARCTECPGFFSRGRSDAADPCLFHLLYPPGGWEGRTPEEVFHATIEYNFHHIRALRDGICPFCAGVVDETLDICESHEVAEGEMCPTCDRFHLVEVRERCRRCKASEWGPLSIAILTHPLVAGFYHEHGIEHEFASSESFLRGAEISEEVLQMDPLRLRVTIPCDNETLRLTLDEELEVVNVVRETSHAVQ